MELSIQRMEVDDLIPYEANSKRHGEEDVSAIARSIEKFGFNDPIAVTPDGVIIEGHGRWMAVQRLGWDTVPVLVVSGLTEDQFDLYRIAHNKIALTSTFNFPALFDALQELVGSDNGIVFGDMGFSDRTVHDLFSHFGDHESANEGSTSTGSKQSTASIEYDIVWETKEEKARFAKFLNDEVAKGGDKAMGGDTLLAAVAVALPDLWANVVAAVPGEVELDHLAGSNEEESVHVAS